MGAFDALSWRLNKRLMVEVAKAVTCAFVTVPIVS